MNAKSILAILLIVSGALALAYQGFTYTKREKVVDLGPVEVTREDKQRVPISPIVGGVALATGVVLLITGARKAS